MILLLNAKFAPFGISLITDPDEIKSLTNNHFQLCSGAVNQDKAIPVQWKDQYAQNHINNNVYNGIMDLEWIQSVSKLPNRKATDPSDISNEMIKHLSDNMQHI